MLCYPLSLPASKSLNTEQYFSSHHSTFPAFKVQTGHHKKNTPRPTPLVPFQEWPESSCCSFPSVRVSEATDPQSLFLRPPRHGHRALLARSDLLKASRGHTPIHRHCEKQRRLTGARAIIRINQPLKCCEYHERAAAA